MPLKLLLFLLWTAFIIIFNVPFQTSFFIGLLFLLPSFYFLIDHQDYLSEQLALFAFYFLLFGLGHYLLQKASIFSKVKPFILPFIFYSLVTFLITFPSVFHLQTHIYGTLGDSAALMRRFWWQKYAQQHQLDPNFSPILSVPFGVNYQDSWPKPIHYSLMGLFTFLVDEIFAYNVVVLWSFFSAGFFAYFLFKEITNNQLLSLILGAVYTFYPYHTVQMLGNLGPAQIQYLPLFFLFLFRLSKKKTFFNAFGLSVGFFLSAMDHFYYGYFLVVTALVFAVARYLYLSWQKKKFLFEWHSGLFYGLAVIIVTILLTIFCFDFVKTVFLHPIETQQTFKFNFDNLIAGASRKWHYLFPSVHHPLWGAKIKDYIVSHFPHWTYHGGGMEDQMLYLGWINLVLVGAFFITLILQKLKLKLPIPISRINNFLTKERKFLIVFSIVLVVVSICFAGPPLKEFYGLTLTPPSFYIYKILPTFRIISRFGIITIIGLMFLVNLGLNFFLQCFPQTRLKYLFLFGYCLFIILDFAIIPPWRVSDISKIPPVYQWLKKQPGDFLVAEYPLLINWLPEFYQRYHLKPLLNGARTEETIVWSKRHQDLLDPGVIEDLKRLQVKYILLYPKNYDFLPPEYKIPTEKNSELILVKKFEKVMIYELGYD